MSRAVGAPLYGSFQKLIVQAHEEEEKGIC
jgi:hypothetical protein